MIIKLTRSEDGISFYINLLNIISFCNSDKYPEGTYIRLGNYPTPLYAEAKESPEEIAKIINRGTMK